jgi:hypothetical protein
MRQFADAVKMCRGLAAAAPLKLLCNNPSCEDFSGVSEAAATASKRCTACRCCNYCSVACQRADWKRHKHACRHIAAAGEAHM